MLRAASQKAVIPSAAEESLRLRKNGRSSFESREPDLGAEGNASLRAMVDGVEAAHAVVEELERFGHGAVRTGVVREAQRVAGELGAGRGDDDLLQADRLSVRRFNRDPAKEVVFAVECRFV